MKKGKIVGIGGIFFRCEDPEKTKAWYKENMGMITSQWGAPFVTKQFTNPDKPSFLQWSPFTLDTDYFGDSDQQYMINYRVENIEELVEDLKNRGVTICDEISTYEYGKFVHVEDGNGIRMELWEPIDTVFEAMYDDDSINKE